MNKKYFTLIKLLAVIILMLSFISVQAQGVDEKYQQTIKSADEYFAKGDYLNAKASYQVASQLKPDEQYPKDRLKESIALLRVQMEQMAVYNEKVSYADRLYNEQSYDNAIIAYEEALKLIPAQDYPREQIEKIRISQAKDAANEARYSELIKQGDVLLTEEKFADARTKFEDASNIYPDRQDAKDKIDAADKKLAEIAAQQSGYQKAISEAEMFHARKDYENELLSYQKASELKPEEAFPQLKIRELNKFIRKYEAYNKFVSEGDDLYILQQFADAKVKYEKALEILPDESYPKEIISKINVSLAEKTVKNKAAYEDAIAKADELYNEEDYESAMIAYSEALRYWPDGEHAKERLGSISEIMAMKKAQEEAYNNTINLADKLFANKEYANAKKEYLNAASIDPFQQYPKVRIDEIEMIMAEIQNKLQQYESIIVGADKLFNAGDYSEARIQYLKAQDMFSDRSYPVDQIKMIDDILGREEATREAYLAAIARGDEHFAKREWEDAKMDYVDATDLIPVEQYPKDKIAEINNIMAQLKAEQETYSLALKTADQLFSENDYSGALLEYRKAADIFQNEEYPKQKIEELTALMADQAAQEALNENYDQAIAEADLFLEQQKYTDAKTSYEKALTYKATEQYPKDKIEEINVILAEQARLQGIEESYATAIAAADGYFTNSQYNEALAEYKKATGIKPEEAYPQQKITEINGILADLLAKAELKAQQDAQYAQAISDGDALFAAEDYSNARQKFNIATGLKPDETYPKTKINEIDGILGNLEQQRILDENYANAIAAADGFFNEEAYTQAKSDYEKASGLKPAEQYPKDKIEEINGILAEQARLQGIEESYASAIAAADGFMANAQYNDAKAEYTKATNLKPEEAYPKEKISEIDGILADLARQQGIDEAYAQAIGTADAFFNEAKYEDAKQSYQAALDIKAEEAYPQEKITEIDGILAEQARLAKLNEEYLVAISTADQLLAELDYEGAKAAYTRALGLKSNEAYPAGQISKIDNILANMEQQRMIDDGYANAIALGDNFFNNKEYAQAKAEFEKALGFKADEQYPKDKISEIDGIMAAEALRLEKEAQYNTAIAEADGFFNAENFTEAKAAYLLALAARPEDAYATEKLASTENELAELARLQDLEKSYNDAIAAADAAFAAGNYQDASTKYSNALSIKPDEQYPKGKVIEIEGLLAEQARLLAIDQQYQDAIAKADSLFALKEYESSRNKYADALAIKSDESYPQEKITEIDGILEALARQKALDDRYAQSIEDADDFLDRGAYLDALNAYEKAAEIKPSETYPKEQIADINSRLSELEEERQIAYDASIVQADSYYDIANWRSAKSAYQTAVNIKPDEQYARDRLDEVSRLYKIELETLTKEYQKYIADADNYFNEKVYDGAIENYRTAAGILPDEEYPGKMISRITKIINDNAITDVNKLAQVIPDNTERKFSFDPLPVSVRKSNYILLKARNVSDHDFKMLVNFGVDGLKTGGVVLPVPKGEIPRDYIIRIGALYKWFSDDNNWLSVYPEGGDVEVGLIRISKSD